MPEVNETKPPGPGGTGTRDGRIVKFLGLVEFPAPSWVGYCLGALVVLGLAAAVYLKIVTPILDARSGRLHREIELNEYNKHLSEPQLHLSTVLEAPELGLLTVGYYASDGCLVITAVSPGNLGSQHHFIQKTIYSVPPPGPTLGGRAAANLQTQVELFANDRRRGDATNYELVRPSGPGEGYLFNASLLPAMAIPVLAQSCTGHCSNPHPGQFRTWNGDRNGCWLAIWRQWPDGCTHYQWYNTCNGAWDSNADGSPKLWWTCCVH